MPYQNERERQSPHQNEEGKKDRFTFKATAERFKKKRSKSKFKLII